MIAMNSIGSSQKDVQFTDSMRSLQSFIETQVSAATNGVNDNPSTTAASCGSQGDGNCVILGRVLIFTKDSDVVEIRTLLGKRLSDDYEDVCSGQTLLECSEPEVEATQRDYNLVWRSQFTGGSHELDGSKYSRAFGFIRNPRSSSVSAVTYNGDVGDSISETITNYIDKDSTYGSISPNMAIGDGVEAHYCFVSQDGDRHAAIVLNGSQVDLVFDDSPEFTYSC